MSLIVAKQFDKNVVFVSDSFISRSNSEVSDYFHRFNEETSTIKTLVINSHMCIAFSGVLDFADEAIRNISETNIGKDQILKYLSMYNIKHRDATDFIIFFGNPYYELYLITGMESPSIRESCYIGNQKAYGLYKRLENSNKETTMEGGTLRLNKIPDSFSENEKTIYTKMHDAMSQVIESDIEDVSGFVVALVYENDNFEYMPEFISNKSMDYFFQKPKQNNRELIYDIGQVEKGDYAINFCCSNGQFYAVHFPLANIGYLYERDFCNKGLFHPKIYFADEIDFFDMLERDKQANREYSVLVHHSEQHFCIKADKLFDQKDYKKALLNYERGLKRMIKGKLGIDFSGHFENIFNIIGNIDDGEMKKY
jgi:hypothetical protein